MAVTLNVVAGGDARSSATCRSPPPACGRAPYCGRAPPCSADTLAGGEGRHLRDATDSREGPRIQRSVASRPRPATLDGAPSRYLPPRSRCAHAEPVRDDGSRYESQSDHAGSAERRGNRKSSHRRTHGSPPSAAHRVSTSRKISRSRRTASAVPTRQCSSITSSQASEIDGGPRALMRVPRSPARIQSGRARAGLHDASAGISSAISRSLFFATLSSVAFGKSSTT